MKNLIISCLLIIGQFSLAQTEVFEKTINYGGKKLDIEADLVGRINVTNWDQDQVAVKVTYSINNGELNDLLEVDLDESSSRIRLEVELDQKQIENANFTNCDEEQSLSWGRNGTRNSICIDVEVEVKMPSGGKLDIESVIGDLFIDGVYQELYAKTVTGDIEMSWPENEGAEVEIKTVNGGIYTNHDFKMKADKGLPLISSHEVEGNIAGGGKYLNLETVTSDIYFRRTK